MNKRPHFYMRHGLWVAEFDDLLGVGSTPAEADFDLLMEWLETLMPLKEEAGQG